MEAVQRLAEFECAVRVQKLGRSTAICDCARELWAFLGLTREQVFFSEGKRPQVCDFPFDIWVCQIGIGNHGTRRTSAYGRSFSEAVEKATSNVEHDRRMAASSPGVRVDGPVGPLSE